MTMKSFHKLKWMLIILMFGWVANVDAQTYWSGTIGTQDITQNTNITLSGDVDLQGIIIINECAVTLDLNGYVIKRNGHGGYACIVSTNGTLTINDSRPNVPHYGKASQFYFDYKYFNCLWEYNASYTASTPGAIRIDGGIISGGFGMIGGGVCCYGHLIMNAGTIAGNNVASDHYMVKNSSGNWVLHTRRPNTCDEMREAWHGMEDGGCYHFLDLNDPSSVTSYNQCMGEGGGVYVGPQGDFTMNGGRICYNYASLHGGGVYVGGPFTMGGSSTIDHNYVAGGYGAGVFVSHDVEFQPCVNGIPNGPWPNYIEECGVMTMNNGTISYNNAYGGSGGGIMGWNRHELTINNGNIHHNLALGRRGQGLGNGGGVYCQGANELKVKNIQITDNECARYGGGMYVYHNSNLAMNQGTCVIARNIARPRSDDPYASSEVRGKGGGIVVTQNSGATVTFSNLVSITNNQARYGGGFYANGATCIFQGTTVDNNTADIDGGGLHVESASITVQQNSKIRNNTATSGRGGGVFVQSSSAVYTQTNSELTNNTAGSNGGGVFMNTGTVTLTNSSLKYNKSNNGNGGGIYAGTGNIIVDNTVLFRNKANNGGGGGIFANLGSSGLITIKNNSIMCKNSAKNGGGLYTNTGNIAFQSGTIGGNTASVNGGGVYANYPVNLSGGIIGRNDTIGGNTADKGGGIYANHNVTLNGGRISGNAANNGGGVYVASGTFTLTNGYVGGLTNLNLGNSTTGSNGKGGGIYMASGTTILQGGGVIGNTALNGGSGGGIYMNGGTCTLSSGASIGGMYSNYGNSATYGGGLYANGGSITVNGGQISYNTATDGGAIYSNSTASVTITKEGSALSQIQYNTATNGGGVYANQGTVTFSDGSINYNYASNAGGGMYVNDGGTLNLKGNAILNRNYVPTGKNGGGIYLKGTVKIGEASGKAQSSVTANMNFAHTLTGSESVTTYTPTNTTRNNIYLPNPVANPYTATQHRDVIWVYEGGIATGSSVGFSVPNNHVPVIYCQRSSNSWTYLDRFTTGEGHDLNTVLFDDTGRYKSVHYTTSPVFDPDHVYLFGFWPEMVNNISQVPSGGFVVNGNTVTIGNKEGLAWLISYVNGLNGSDPHNSEDLVVNLEADLDMSAYGWVPIGFKGNGSSTPAPFRGTFNGKGHTIKGIYGLVYGQGDQGVWDYGLFGYVDGGLIQDVFVKGMEYYIDNNENLILGGLVGEKANGVVSNSEVQSKLVAQNAQSLIGGLIGKQGGGMLHSSIGIADMTGGRMGGLVGQNNGNLYNSFANAKFTSIDNTKYAGGLVAINSGMVENCYVHLRGTAPGTTANYGWLVGDNQTDGEVNYCYSPATDRYYKINDGTLKGCGHYADNASAPYLYARLDNQVEIADNTINNVTTNPHVPTAVNPNPLSDYCDKQLLLCLNHWVGTSSTYAPWQRPTTMVINGDLPVLMMPKADAAAATTGDPYIDYDQVNTLLSEYTQATQAVWLYKKKDGLAGNSTSNAKLYIAEKGSDGYPVTVKPSGTVKAYVGVMLDNSAGVNGANPTFGDGTPDYTDWHMFSSPLTSAPVGINYTNDIQYDFSWEHPTSPSVMPYWRFYPESDDNHGYFPSHRYGVEYPANDASLLAGNYYNEWDIYTYYEPEYHWINFKRNSNSHWHENATDAQIHYHAYSGAPEGNETTLVQGKGYLLATREQTFLQCQGTLADGNVTIPVTYSGFYSPGYNFLGNPYLSYLDFDKFVTLVPDNMTLFSSGAAGYAIIDEDPVPGEAPEHAAERGGYKYYTYNNSQNTYGATKYIAPHQGFMILAANAGTATFTNDMRDLNGDGGKFRGDERPAYPLVNMLAYDDNGNRSIATVELGRPDQGGLQLMRDLKGAKCHVYYRYEGEDWTIAFTQPGITEVPVRFEAYADGEYTLRWNTQNGEFHYLHLVDNLTGTDIDCLTTDEYRFASTTTDYKSRFRLVFGYTGIEEPEGDDPAQGSFAYQSGDELVVTGEGTVELFDVTGRRMSAEHIEGVQGTMSVSGLTPGVYLLRLDTATGTRVQKIVINQ